MDGEVFYGALQGGEQTKPFGVQGVFGRELQAAEFVNLRLQAINKYLEFTKQEKLKVKFVKVQQKNFWRM